MQIFNTLTRQKEEFVPQVPGEYRIYVCGPTVPNGADCKSAVFRLRWFESIFAHTF